MNARLYDAGAGIFTSVDPVFADMYRTGGLNAYGYVYGNPFSFVDPDGKEGRLNLRQYDDFQLARFTFSPRNPELDALHAAYNQERYENRVQIIQGIQESLSGALDGGASVFKGSYQSVRFVARGTGVLGKQEYSEFSKEAAIVDRSAIVGGSILLDTITSEEGRSLLTQEIYDAAQGFQTTRYQRGRIIGRLATGLFLAPLGALAGIGDVTHSVENQVEQGAVSINKNVLEDLMYGF